MENQSKLHKALADNNRIVILKLLLKYDLCVGALSKRLNISKSAISQHLKILREVGLVWGEKRGYFTHYYVDRNLLKEAARQLNELSNLPRGPSECLHSHSNNHSCGRKERKQNV